jgi:hypothetical protein
MSETRSNDIKTLRASTADMVNDGGLYKIVWTRYERVPRLDKLRVVPRGYSHSVCGYLISHPGLDYHA